VRIPLPSLMRHWREREFERHLSPATVRTGLRFWAVLATRPKLYAVAMSLFVLGLGLAGKLVGRFRWLPLAGGWTRHRDFPAPSVQTFQAQWKRRVRSQ
jgi:L-lactate dehydrogenase complex protein LldF